VPLHHRHHGSFHFQMTVMGATIFNNLP